MERERGLSPMEKEGLSSAAAAVKVNVRWTQKEAEVR